MWRERGTKSILLVPIVVRGEMIGTIGVDATGAPHRFTDAEIDLAARVAEQLSVAMQNARLAEELHRRAEDLESLNVIGQVVSSSLNLTTVLDRVLSSLRDIVAYDRASIAVIEPDMEHLLVVSDTAEGGGQRGQQIPIAGTLRGHVFTSATLALYRRRSEGGTAAAARSLRSRNTRRTWWSHPSSSPASPSACSPCSATARAN